MEENKAYKPDYIENQTNNNCQQFFGPVSGCVFAMPGSDVHMPEAKETDSSTELQKHQVEEELFHYINPKVTDDRERKKIHLAVKNLVSNYPLPEIFNHLSKMAEEERIYYKTLNHAVVRKELERLGMPDKNAANFATKTFEKYFR